MEKRNCLQTVRMSPREKNLVGEYLRKNPVFESFSALARTATLSFIGERSALNLQPVSPASARARPGFLWDYDLSEAQVRETLSRPGKSEAKLWLIARILAQAGYEEVFSYLTLEEIQRALPHLRLTPRVRERWEYAIQRWTKNK